ncbi:putative defense protein isoform X1 [Acanthaster planci]|uniref:Defense protein isoform X1 n=1 Tax=Acanthaster planci TaxID=133434 RepID=A0A8B7YXD8_ACAPL|nr:putative defense protein isoform X1 [Acanthaster planci]
MENAALLIAMLFLLPKFAFSYPSGPPVAIQRVCRDMDPVGHRPRTASGPAPYTIQISRYRYGPKQPVHVTVRADVGASFQGFFLQARRQATGRDTTEALGEFTSISSGTRFLTCVNPSSAWGHNSATPKTSVTATWTPPSTDQGPIIFRATIVKGPASEFWTNVESPAMFFSSRWRENVEVQTTSAPWATTKRRICVGKSNSSYSFRPSVTVTTVVLAFTAILLATHVGSI